MRLGLFALAVGTLGAACSLIVQFDPEGQACGPSGECLAGYRCVGGSCHKGTADAGDPCSGVTCTTPGPCQQGTGTCNAITGKCVYPAKPLNDTCTDNDLCTQGDHCDGDGGCAPTSVVKCNSPPGACYSDAGTCSPSSGACSYAKLNLNDPCEDGNPCTVGETCGAGDVCSGGSARVCNTPPSVCALAPGTCDPVQGCVYPQRPGVTTCDDGNACTVGDACDAGSCVPGPVCPPPLPCQVGSCNGDGGCTYAAAGDGTSCGANASQRCCNGNCVDISTNPLHCGGCGLACASLSCQSVAVTNACTSFPTATSGRCTCPSNVCPRGQTCRAVLPYSGVCAPADAGECAPNEKVQNLATCPNYCFY